METSRHQPLLIGGVAGQACPGFRASCPACSSNPEAYGPAQSAEPTCTAAPTATAQLGWDAAAMAATAAHRMRSALSPAFQLIRVGHCCPCINCLNRHFLPTALWPQPLAKPTARP